MTLQAEAPRIWNLPVDGTCPQVQPFTLIELMHGIPEHPNYLVQSGSCFVRGVTSMPKSEEEFEATVTRVINKTIEVYTKNNHADPTEEQVQRATRLLKENFCGQYTNSFRVFRYVDTDGRSIADGLPYQGIITDRNWLTILYFDTQEITVLPFGDPESGPHRNLFYDARGKIAGSRWGYDGNLETALSEFHQRGFTFNVARLPSNLEDHMQLMREFSNAPANRRINGMITHTNLPLGQILTIITNPPV